MNIHEARPAIVDWSFEKDPSLAATVYWPRRS
jgi:hypothetical protein